MHAITVKQPWAEAIARHGKTIENRTRRPPWGLIGQRIAIHVGQATDAWVEAHAAGILSLEPPHLKPLLDWVIDPCAGAMPRRDNVPNAGRIIATARLVGWVADDGTAAWAPGILGVNARESPWFTGPVGWVLADVRALQAPVVDSAPCKVCKGLKFDPSSSHTCCKCDGTGQQDKAIRGQVYPFELTPEVAAAVLAAESQP